MVCLSFCHFTDVLLGGGKIRLRRAVVQTQSVISGFLRARATEAFQLRAFSAMKRRQSPPSGGFQEIEMK